jgi:DNA helicase HerA-like ATPase
MNEQIKSEDIIGGGDMVEAQLPIGRIVSVTGSSVIVQLRNEIIPSVKAAARPEVGTILKVQVPNGETLGILSGLSIPVPSNDADNSEIMIAELQLLGEFRRHEDGSLGSFNRGVTGYPSLGDSVFETDRRELNLIYAASGSPSSFPVGKIHQDPTVKAHIDLDGLLGKHFAILGSTGSGKSCAAAIFLNRIIERHENSHIVLLDPHNEYKAAFGNKAEVISPATLELPYWLFNFDELCEVVIGARESTRDQQVEILADAITQAKTRYSTSTNTKPGAVIRKVKDPIKISTNSPTPYRLADVISRIDEIAGSLERSHDLVPCRRLKLRLETLSQDARYTFMMGNSMVLDTMAQIVGRIFRVPVDGKPITILDLSAVPTEVLNTVVSVICRMAFDFALWSNKAMPISLICEEAHRYLPNKTTGGFEPAKRAISRIAKEGRKYGVSLGIISQRPSELDATILSQLSSIFVLRTANQRDQEFVEATVNDSAMGLLDFLPSLGVGEAIAIGEAVSMPMRLFFDQLPEDKVPQSQSAVFSRDWDQEAEGEEFLEQVIARWRKQQKRMAS